MIFCECTCGMRFANTTHLQMHQSSCIDSTPNRRKSSRTKYIPKKLQNNGSPIIVINNKDDVEKKMIEHHGIEDKKEEGQNIERGEAVDEVEMEGEKNDEKEKEEDQEEEDPEEEEDKEVVEEVEVESEKSDEKDQDPEEEEEDKQREMNVEEVDGRKEEDEDKKEVDERKEEDEDKKEAEGKEEDHNEEVEIGKQLHQEQQIHREQQIHQLKRELSEAKPLIEDKQEKIIKQVNGMEKGKEKRESLKVCIAEKDKKIEKLEEEKNVSIKRNADRMKSMNDNLNEEKRKVIVLQESVSYHMTENTKIKANTKVMKENLHCNELMKGDVESMRKDLNDFKKFMWHEIGQLKRTKPDKKEIPKVTFENNNTLRYGNNNREPEEMSSDEDHVPASYEKRMLKRKEC